MRDIEKFIEGLHDYIGKALRPIADQVRSLVLRVEELAARAPEKGDPGESIKGDPGEPGRDGRDAPAEDELRAWIDEAVAGIPAPKDGEAGADGKTPTEDEIRTITEPVLLGLLDQALPAAVASAVQALPKAPTAEEIKACAMEGIDALVAERVSALPPAEPGRPGEDGKSVSVEDVIAALSPRLDGELAKWALEFERRAQDTLQRAIDRMPKPADGRDGVDGKDGRNGLDLKHFSAVQDGRTVLLTLKDDERTEHVHLTFPVVLDKGFWKPGTLAEAGDGVTFGGSYWIAQKDTDTQPEVGNPDWRLAVRKGRDARGGVPNQRDPAKPVRISESDA